MRKGVIFLFILLVGGYIAYQLMPGSSKAFAEVSSVNSIHEWNIESWLKAGSGLIVALVVLSLVWMLLDRSSRSSRYQR